MTDEHPADDTDPEEVQQLYDQFQAQLWGRRPTSPEEDEALGLAIELGNVERDARVAVLRESATLEEVPGDSGETLVDDLHAALYAAAALADDWRDGRQLTDVAWAVRGLRDASENLLGTIARCYPGVDPAEFGIASK